MPFGGLLGSTFNFVFENQLEKLQDGDRFYYLDRTAGLNFNAELETNSFAKLIMANTDATHLPGVVFKTPAFTLEVDPTRQHTGLDEPGADGLQRTADDTVGADGIAGNSDPVGGTTIGSVEIVPLVIRDNPNTVGPDTNYLQYNGPDHVVLGGTAGNDIIVSSEGDDTLYGDQGNDFLDGGFGNDFIRGGDGDDIITDLGGDDTMQGDGGNDVIHGGNGINLILGGFGNDFIVTGEDSNESFGGQGNDFILGTKADEQNMGNEGDDWLEYGNLDGNPGDNFDPLGRDLVPGNDIFLGSGQTDIMPGQGGDDIMVGSPGPGDKYLGASGFDWATFKDDKFGAGIDLNVRALDVGPGPVADAIVARFSAVEGLSGSHFSDILRGDNADANIIPTAGPHGSVLTNFDLISGLRAFVGTAGAGPDGIVGTADDRFGAGNIILGGNGSDIIEGRWGDDLIDGDKWLNVRISVRANADGTGAEIASYDSMVPMVPLMLNGTYSAGQLVAVREILPGDGGFSFDTAVFSGNRLDYDIVPDNNGTPLDFTDDFITVTDLVGLDGTDRLTNIERLQFSDQAIVLAPGLNSEPVGLLTLNDPTPEVGNTLTVSIAGVTDADNTASGGAITGPVSFVWQFEPIPGSGVFQDILVRTGLGAESVTGPSFTVLASFDDGIPSAGLAIRVKALYQDENGVLETVFSAPSGPVSAVQVNDAPVGTVLISDTTPIQGQLLTATDAFTDVEGITTSIVTHQWQAGTGDVFTDIAGATGLTFTTTQAQVGLSIRVVASYTDDGGTFEQVFSAPTGLVGVVAIGTAGADTLTGTAGDDDLQGRAGNDTLNGLAGNDLLLGEAGNDLLNGGAGADTMTGGAGNDTYIVDDVLDTVIEAAGAGTDLVRTTLSSYTLGANVENLSFIGAGDFSGTGNALNNVITGGSGADTMAGLAGNDTYVVNNAGDVVIEAANAGIDTVRTTLSSYTLGANVENLTFVGTGDFSGTGNALNNRLQGGSGTDTLAGGAGNDTYVIDTATDQVVELAGAGTDTVQTRLSSYTLAANVENVTFIGTGSFSGTGNALNNAMLGGSGADTLSGGGGNDFLIANAGNDALNGGAGNDFLNGGAGADTMAGGAGSDIYLVDNALDSVNELAGEGTDTAQTALSSYTLGANVENLTFTSAAAHTGTGNALANTLRGNSGADRLDGGAGNDLLFGGAGSDVFVFAAAGFGNDRVQGFDADPVGGQDLLDISGLGITAATFAGAVSITDLGADTLVGIGADSIRLLGVGDATTIAVGDFLLAA
jgi:Ca2+-binding RTX toxin-like protein